MISKEALANIVRPHKNCMNCNAPIQEMPNHPSVLRHEGDELQRWDYCPACWEVIKREIYDCFWLARREQKPKGMPKLNRRQRNAALRALFESLWDRREEEDSAPHLFILAHLLMKWGGLKYLNETDGEDGRKYLVFEDPVSGDKLEIESMELEDERVLEVREAIENFLRESAQDREVEL